MKPRNLETIKCIECGKEFTSQKSLKRKFCCKECYYKSLIEYNDEVVSKTNEYIDSCEDEENQYLSGLSVKGTELYKTKLKVNLPTIEGLALYLEVNRDTIYDWEGKYKEFSDILGKLRAKQAKCLIDNGLSGDYNPTIAKVLLTKHGYREGLEQTGKDGERLLLSEEQINTLKDKLLKEKR